jgi:hypothetical protein
MVCVPMGNRLLTRRVRKETVNAAVDDSRMKPVKLRIVASMLHHERSGHRRDSMRGPEYIRQLNEAAAALGRVADIYRLEDGDMRHISKEELRGAEYLDGGNIVRTTAGALYHPLAMRRAEAIGAIALLSSPE